MLPPRQRSPLFPYTTLFRSSQLGHRLPIQRRLLAAEIAASGDFRLIRQVGDDRNQDRKSTRLNSSHVRISYAVFCLKKKKKSRPTGAPPSLITPRTRTHGGI